MSERRPTYETYVLHTIMPAPGWQAVYVAQDHTHFLIPLAALALVTIRTRDATTGKRLPAPDGEPEDERRDVRGMTYNPVDGFTLEGEGNFCGLLPPGMSLADFAQYGSCRHPTPEGDA